MANKIKTIKDIIDKVIISANREIQVFGHIPLSLATVKLEYEPINRHRRATKRWEINPFQRGTPETSRFCCKLPFCNN